MNRTQSFSHGLPGHSVPVHLSTAQAFRRCEQRLDVLCDLIDEELRNGQVGDRELEDFVKKITGEVDLAMSQEDCWFDEGGFIS
ncbi:MAG: hypothetical protein ACO1RT_19230 [Planctomycetaceae bacterium]